MMSDFTNSFSDQSVSEIFFRGNSSLDKTNEHPLSNGEMLELFEKSVHFLKKDRDNL